MRDLSLFQLVYVSRLLEPISDEQLRSLQEGALRFNEPRRITGALFVSPTAAMQVLEGDFTAVTMMYDGRISVDPRHTDLRIVFGAYTERRLYENWNMAVFRVDRPPISYDDLLERLADAAFTPDPRRTPLRLIRVFEEARAEAA